MNLASTDEGGGSNGTKPTCCLLALAGLPRCTYICIRIGLCKQPPHFRKGAVRSAAGAAPRCLLAGAAHAAGHRRRLAAGRRRGGSTCAAATVASATATGPGKVLHEGRQPAGAHGRRAGLHREVELRRARPFYPLLLLRCRRSRPCCAALLLRCCRALPAAGAPRPLLCQRVELRQAAAAPHAVPAAVQAAAPAAAAVSRRAAAGPAAQARTLGGMQAAGRGSLQLALQLPCVHGAWRGAGRRARAGRVGRSGQSGPRLLHTCTLLCSQAAACSTT